MVWFLSDNGGTKGNQTTSKLTRGAKGSFYEGGIRVPCILWAPGRILPGSVSDELILTFDIMPTTLAMLGVEMPEGRSLDGIDVSAALFANKALPPMKRFWNRENSGALRDGPWKLVVSGIKSELFDLKKDPQETKNLAAKFPERTSDMRKIYESMLKETRADSPYPIPKVEPTTRRRNAK
jgi:arylsulfatase A-like enzyme